MSFLSRLFPSDAGKVTTTEAPAATAPEVAAPEPAPEVGAGELLRRETVLDAKLRVVGYDFRRCTGADCPAQLAPLLAREDMAQLLVRRFAFVSLCGGCADAIEAGVLPPGQIAIGIPAGPALSVAARMARVRACKSLGLAVFLDGSLPELAESDVLDLVDYARLDLCDGVEACRAVLPRLAAHRVLPMARRVDSLATFDAARAAGFAFFQGHGWQAPRPDHARSNALRGHVLELINLTKVQADLSDLEGVLLRDPLLSYQLLRFVNSPGGGLVQPVRSMGQALMVLGYQPLYRWLVTLLYTAGEHDERAEALLRIALTRARLMETLGGDALGRAHRDGLYLTGMFSLLDVLLAQSMNTALAGLSLARPVVDALLQRQGPYGPWLVLATALEGASDEAARAAANTVGVAASVINEAHIEALCWADQVAD